MCKCPTHLTDYFTLERVFDDVGRDSHQLSSGSRLVLNLILHLVQKFTGDNKPRLHYITPRDITANFPVDSRDQSQLSVTICSGTNACSEDDF